MKITTEQELYLDQHKIVVLKIKNKNNIEILFTNYGATIMAIFVPKKNGDKKDITLGYKNIDEILKNYENPEQYYFGNTIGRYANRIANSQFKIHNKTYQLTKNEGENHLHGGFKGLHKVIWNYSINSKNNEVIFNYTSKDGDEGYPGNLNISLSVSLNDSGEIKLKYKAQTDKLTPVNFTNHIYFNLNGGINNILNHFVKIHSNSILEVNEQNIPTGKLIDILKTEYDLNNARQLKQNKIINRGGYDNCYVLSKVKNKLDLVAEISEENNPVSVKMFTTEPALQFYTSNGFDGSFIGKNNITYNKFNGLCLEAQNFPDSPNHKNFPNSILKPDKQYKQVTIYKIHIKNE